MQLIFPPGTILQNMHLKSRLSKLRPGKFIEVGVGRGYISHILLERGWEGIGFDLSQTATEWAGSLNQAFINSGHYKLKKENFLDALNTDRVDLIISSMVIEHLSTEDEDRYFQKCHELLHASGICIVLVPSNQKCWGIEDEIAGHYRRYSHETLISNVPPGWRLQNLSGLTFPLSNCLLPLSNFLVKKRERHKRSLSLELRTQSSGVRRVPFKTTFPSWLGFILNETFLYPFHIAQKLFARSCRCMVLYAEWKRNKS